MGQKMKIALVTGAGAGIGRAAALALLADGWKVFLTGRRLQTLEETAQMSSNPGNAVAIACDVGVPEQVDQLFAEIQVQAGRLDTIFNNAGTFCPANNFGDVSFEDWRSVLSVNLDGAFLIANRAYQMMRDQTPQGGRIINNGSIAAYVPRPQAAPYTASKHAITGLTRSIALDGREHNIVCSQIDIGNAATDMTKAMEAGALQPDGSRKSEPTFDVAHVGQAVLSMANLPLEANILFSTLMASDMPYVGRG